MNIYDAQEILAETAWTRPDSYCGYNPEDHYILYSVTRDCTILDHTNFKLFKEALTTLAEKYDNTCECDSEEDGTSQIVYTFTASHWACGYVEYLMLHNNASEDLQVLAAEMLASLADYPILDDMAYSDAQYDAIWEYWEKQSIRDRVADLDNATNGDYSYLDMLQCRHDIPETVYNDLSSHSFY